MKKRNLKKIAFFAFTVALAIALIVPCQSILARSNMKDTLLIAVKSEPDTIIPSDSRLTTICVPITNNIFDRAVELTPDGRFENGILFWEVLNGGKEFMFTVRNGVKFHSGDPLTAEDVKFSHDRFWEKSPTYKRYLPTLEKVEVLDKYRVKFTFSKPDVTFIPRRALHIMSKSYFDRVGEKEFVEKPVGTGPYKLITWKHGEYLEMERFDDYWGRLPTVKKAQFSFLGEDTTRVAALRTGEMDIIMDTPWTLVHDIKDKGFKTVELAAHPPCSVQFHNHNPKVPWFKKDVRMAIALAIDKEAIINDLFHGIPAAYPRLGPYELGYDPEIKQYPYDPKKAKQLLKDAGYPKGFEMPLYYLAGRSYGQKETAEIVALYLNAVGIKAKIQGIEAAQFIGKIRNWHSDLSAEYVGISTVPMAFTPEPMDPLSSAYHSSGWGALYYNERDLDPIIEEAIMTTDDAKRAKLIQKAIRVIHDDVGTIQIWANNSVYAMQKNIEFTPTLKNMEPLLLVKDVLIN